MSEAKKVAIGVVGGILGIARPDDCRQRRGIQTGGKSRHATQTGALGNGQASTTLDPIHPPEQNIIAFINFVETCNL